MISIPDVYPLPYGIPLYWGDERSELPAAMMAYVRHAADSSHPAPTDEQLELVIAYCRYYINAPCWMGAELATLRQRADELKTVGDVTAWLDDCGESHLDPI